MHYFYLKTEKCFGIVKLNRKGYPKLYEGTARVKFGNSKWHIKRNLSADRFLTFSNHYKNCTYFILFYYASAICVPENFYSSISTCDFSKFFICTSNSAFVLSIKLLICFFISSYSEFNSSILCVALEIIS